MEGGIEARRSLGLASSAFFTITLSSSSRRRCKETVLASTLLLGVLTLRLFSAD
jgi:hypothetical protein